MKLILYYFFILLSLISELSQADPLTLEEELFNSVLENPSSLDLNLELATTQLQFRNLKGASVTLDRILQLYPGNAKAQILLAEVELKLENVFTAKNLFKDVINNNSATDEQKRIAGEYLTKLYAAEQKWKWIANGMLSSGRSKNPISSPKYITILGDAYSNPQFDDSSDNFTEVYTSLGFKYFLESQTESTLSPTINFYQRKYDRQSKADISNLSFNLAYDTEFLNGRNIYNVSYAETELQNQPFVNSYSLSFNHKRLITPNFLLNAGAVISKNDHQECDHCASSQARTNLMRGGNLNLNTNLLNIFSLDLNASYSEFAAKATFESYQLIQGGGALGYGTDFGLWQASINFSTSEYDDIDPIASVKKKIETKVAGLSFITSLPYFRKPKTEDWLLKLNVQHGRSDSGIETYKKDIEETSIAILKSF